ncbi:MAG: hypothetical protein KDA64_18355, partial [Rhodospirillaceae bacterium]|nr:hypothetical protein [Rhodospirillaceae bacterium]
MKAETDPFGLLCRLLAQGDGKIAAASIGGLRHPAVCALVSSGLLVQDGALPTTICDACDEAHPAEVTFDPSTRGHGWYCPEVGFVPAEPDKVAALATTLERAARCLRSAFGAAFGNGRWAVRHIEGVDAWVVGVWTISGAATTVVLGRSLENALNSAALRNALAELAPNEAGLVLTIGEDGGFEPPARFDKVPLADAATVGETGLILDGDLLSRIVAPHAVGRRVAHVGQPSVKVQVWAILVSSEPSRL